MPGHRPAELRDHLRLRLHEYVLPRVSDRLVVPRLAAEAGAALLRRDRRGARRRWALVRGRALGRAGSPPPELRALVLAALDAAQVDRYTQVSLVGLAAPVDAGWLEGSGRRVGVVAGLEELGSAEVAVVLGLGSLGALDAEQALRRLAATGASAFVPVAPWPQGRGVAMADPSIAVLRSRGWWRAAAAAAGLESWMELRSPAAGWECLVLRPIRAVPAAPAPPRPRPGPRIRIHDDLSIGGSFAWVTASIALALDDAGVPVSIAPGRVSRSFDAAWRERIERLMDRDAGGREADCELGWTHFWWRYRRRLGGRYPLALFAVNYEFETGVADEHDPWLRGLTRGTVPLAPISTFCRQVLVDAGVAPERAHVVPLGFSRGLELAEPGSVPGARELKLLHVTNAHDLERNGTDVALAAFDSAFEPRDDVTLVVRDYGGASAELAARTGALAERGYDVRYWPAFYAEDRLGSVIGAFDALLAPFRGEGFGIKILDAMACGVPPVAPFYGGPRDFLDADVAYPVPYDLVPVAAGYDSKRLSLGNGPLWAECRTQALAAVLRTVAGDPDDRARRGDRARRKALEDFGWDKTAERIVGVVERALT